MARSRRESDFYDVTSRRCLIKILFRSVGTQSVKRKITPKIMQNLVFLMEPSNDAYRFNLEGGDMYLNRFAIDEDAAFEVSGVYHLIKSSENKSKGNEYLPGF